MKKSASSFHSRSTGKKHVALLIAICLSLTYATAQLTPAYDPAWGLPLQTASDEFNGTTVDLTKWLIYSPNFTNVDMSVQNVVMDAAYPTNSNQTGALRLKFTAVDPTQPPTLSANPGGFKGAMIGSGQYYPYKYGFYEIRAKMPGYLNGNNQLTELGIIPQWWTTKSCWCDPNPAYGCPDANTSIAEEVDIIEGDGLTNKDFAIDTHWWYETGNCTEGTTPHRSVNYPYQPIETDMVNTFHKYGFELMPDRMNFYFDDVLTFTFMNPIGVPTHTHAIMLGLAYACPPNDPVVIDPVAQISSNPQNSTMEFIVDYFRYYEMITANCSVDYGISTNNLLTIFPAEIRRNVNVTGTITMAPNTSKIIRHSGDFTVPNTVSDFEVPVGADLTILPTPCH
jgi:beta-glucanase (GH16 family)